MLTQPRVDPPKNFQNCGMSNAKRSFSATSFGGRLVSSSKMAKSPRAFGIFWKLVGKQFVHFSCLHSSTRLLASSGLFLFVHCTFKTSKTVRGIPTFLSRAFIEPWKPPTSQKYYKIQARAALWAKTHWCLISFATADSGVPSDSFGAPSRPPSWL